VTGALGQLTGIGNSASTTNFTSFSNRNFVLGSKQTTAADYLFGYSYFPGGGLKTLTYPSQRQVTYSLNAAGQITQVQNGTSTSSPSYASGIQYAPHGAIQQMTLGNQLIEQTQFNARLQPCAIRVGATAIPLGTTCPTDLSGARSGLLYLVYDYGTTNNNGNLLSQQIAASDPNISLRWTQNYAYDSLNRLTTAGEVATLPLPNGATAKPWNLTNGYDAYGNRSETASWGLGGLTPTASAQFDAATNRLKYLNDGTPMPADGYDNAGNLTDHPSLGTMKYDAENRMARYSNGGNVTQYTYDGDGRRVTKLVTGNTPSSTTYVYDATGQLAAEYSTGAVQDSGTTYLSADHLGSTRLVTDGSGNPIHRFDYMPFGEDLSGFGNRNLMASYNMSAVPTEKFTGKERDAESGLDYFGARYLSSAQGRFTSPDPHNEGAQLVDPQSWNMYSYVGNNPLRYVDPDGEDRTVCIGDKCQDMTDAQFDEWYKKYHDRVILTPGGRLLDRETEKQIGSAQWFNGDAERRANNAIGLLNFFVVNQSINMATEGLGAWIAGLRAGAASRAAFQGGIRLQGAVAERIAGAQLALKGYRIVGKQVRVMTSAGERVVDYIVERAGEYTAIEVKSGGAVRDAGQLAKDAAMASEGGLVKNAAGGVRTELTGQTMKLKTVEVRPF
jgi:RHS repeat-associated protein